MSARTESSTPSELPRWRRTALVPFGVTLLFLAFALLPHVRGEERLLWTFLGTGALLLVWTLLLSLRARRGGMRFRIDPAVILPSHTIQASVQLCIYAVWGWYWRKVYDEAPLILAQLVFLYAFDQLLNWSRGRAWRLGFGPLPIILSTNVFIWFKDDWFAFQFAMIAACALGKEFLRWKRDGKKTHIFNPSSFGLGLVSIVLIATGTTGYTWGPEVAATLGLPPHMYVVIFALGLVVQYFFAVTLMTLSAVAVLVLCDLVFHWSTGTYHFVDTNIPIAIFLGLHLLVTDPATSPRTNLGRVVFGGLYGLGNFVLYDVLGRMGVPDFYDKLLPVPLLNLSVQLIDRFANLDFFGRLRRWSAAVAPRKVNLVHMGVWVGLFTAMVATGFVEGPHAGSSIAFWKQAALEDKPLANQKLIKVVGAKAGAGSASACNEMGLLYMEGRIVPQNRAAAAHYFARACALGDPAGAANVAIQFLYLREAASDADVARAFARLEQACATGGDGRSAQLLGYACEMGFGRPKDLERAAAWYEQGRAQGDADAAKGLARIRGGTAGMPASSAVPSFVASIDPSH